MDNNESIKIKEIQEFKCGGKLPEDRGFFSSLKIDQNDVFLHGGSNDKKEFDQIHILDTSKHSFIQKISLGSLFKTSLPKASFLFSIRIYPDILPTLYALMVLKRSLFSEDFHVIPT